MRSGFFESSIRAAARRVFIIVSDILNFRAWPAGTELRS
jgi:hypothetical protein